MTRWNPWRSVLAGAVIGFVEAAGSEEDRRAVRRPPAVVRQDHRPLPQLRPPAGLWFLEPLLGVRRCFSRN